MIGDTIAAISTPWGDGGIAVIRMSGPDSFLVARKIVRTVKAHDEIKPRFMHNGTLLDEMGSPIDEVLVVYFKSPKTYTGEDLAEIHCHGGSLVAQKCLERCLKSGCRHAEPGEFTRRAFENGRIDLTQAEAVNGIIQARSLEALKSANRTLRGELSKFINEIYDELMSLSAELEVAIDFPEEDTPYLPDQEATDRIETVTKDLLDLLDRCNTGYLLREGIRVALVGRPNVGKSSILNALLKESRAIVTAVPGTTRDVIEEVLTHKGVPIRLMDTAGLREIPSDEVEAIGIERTSQAMKESDLVLWILDGSEGLCDYDRELAGLIKNKSNVIAVNKSDLPTILDDDEINSIAPDSTVLHVSALNKKGMEELKEAILQTASGSGALEGGLNATARQLLELRTAIESLGRAKSSLSQMKDQTLAASAVTEAIGALERLLGIANDDSLLDVVFSKFCIGK